MILPDDITTTTLSHWMVEHQMNRTGLSELLGISKASIDRWMCQNSIPEHRHTHITRVLNDYMTRLQDHRHINTPYGGVRTEASLYTAEEWARLHQAADIMGVTTQEFQKRAVVWALKKLQRTSVDTDEELTQEES